MNIKATYNVCKEKLIEKHFEESLLFVAVGIISSIVCSVYAILFTAIEKGSHSFFTANGTLMYFAAPACLIGSYSLVRWLAPGSFGSGIPQVLVSLDASHSSLARIFLSKSVIFVKMLSSLVALFAGAAIGREGPSLQISAAIAHNLGKTFSRFGIKVKSEQLIVAGAASGLAAAFNTPIGGVVYAIEELSKEHIRTFRDVLLLSVVIAGITAQLINGSYLYLGYPEIAKNYSLANYLTIALASLFAGICGALFSKLLVKLSFWRNKLTLRSQIIFVALIGVLFALVFNFFGADCLYSGKESINRVLFTKTEIPLFETLSRVFMPILSSMTGIAGGIFAPSLSAGAMIGESISQFADPTIRNTIAICGMVGFLTGVTHTPITSFILVLEMTDRHSAVFPMMIAGVMASAGAHLISEKSFYEEAAENIKKAS